MDELTSLSRNIIENFLDFVEEFGFVPNGARIYYLNRSQPPLLAQMVKIYVDYTNDTSLLERAVPLLVKEHEFWIQNRTIDIESDGKTYSLAQWVHRHMNLLQATSTNRPKATRFPTRSRGPSPSVRTSSPPITSRTMRSRALFIPR